LRSLLPVRRTATGDPHTHMPINLCACAPDEVEKSVTADPSTLSPLGGAGRSRNARGPTLLRALMCVFVRVCVCAVPDPAAADSVLVSYQTLIRAQDEEIRGLRAALADATVPAPIHSNHA
jgi:hypothetical protein